MIELITITPHGSRPFYLWHKNGRRWSRLFSSLQSAYAWRADRKAQSFLPSSKVRRIV
jgi:hypothetical protein